MYTAKITNITENDIGVIVFCTFKNFKTSEETSESKHFGIDNATEADINSWREKRKAELQDNYETRISLKAQLQQKAEELKTLLVDSEI